MRVFPDFCTRHVSTYYNGIALCGPLLTLKDWHSQFSWQVFAILKSCLYQVIFEVEDHKDK